MKHRGMFCALPYTPEQELTETTPVLYRQIYEFSGDWGMIDWATSKDSIHGGGGHRKGEPEIVVEDGGLKIQVQK